MNIEKTIEQTESYGYYHDRYTVTIEAKFDAEELKTTPELSLCYNDGIISYIKYIENMAVVLKPVNQEDYNLPEHK